MSQDGSDLSAPRPLHGEYATGDLIVAVEGGRIVTPTDTIEGGTVILEGDRIDRVRRDSAPLADRVIDASDRVVMPGIVDIHGDDFEHHLVPRSGARVDPQTAFTAADRLNVTHGITTKIHAVAFEEDDAGHRSPTEARQLIHALARTPDLLATNLVHARFERSALDPELARETLADDLVVLASLMHHSPGTGEYVDREAFQERYAGDADLDPALVDSIAEERAGTPEEWNDTAATFVRTAQDHGVPVASHDDADAESVERAAANGVDICEFPLSKEAITRAASLGLRTVMGAPNLVRGGSLFDNLATDAAIEQAVVDVLCADYHPPSLLQAAFVDTGEPLHRRIARVSETPANLLGLGDRGRIAAGARADLVIVDPDPVPTATDVIVGGRLVVSQEPETQ